MSPRLLAQVIAAGRVVIGLLLLAAPTAVTRRWIGEDEAERTGARVMAMGLGVRDVAVGAGALAALKAGGDTAKPWLLGSALADLGDLAAILRHRGKVPTSALAGTVLVAGGAAAAGLYVLASDDV
jgi:hypothetical protein